MSAGMNGTRREPVRLRRGDPLVVELPDGDEVEIPVATAGQYRECLKLDESWEGSLEDKQLAQVEILAGDAVAVDGLTPYAVGQLLRALVCHYHGIDPNVDAELQDLMKKKALADLLSKHGTRLPSNSPIT